jgi:hypothetical protein
MFPVKCKDNLPIDHIMIHTIAIRGRLGPITVWISSEEEQTVPNNLRRFHLNPRCWDKIYEKSHSPSLQAFQPLDLSQNPIILRPGQVKAIYIHSTLDGDEAIVYDNRHNRRTYDDKFISILTGRAHVSNTPFGSIPIWGWGNAWREPREFVGRIGYGAVYKLWNPSQAHLFGNHFQTLVRTLLLCQRRWESNISRLPDDCIFYILNMCRWDWFMDTPQDMKLLKQRRLIRMAASAAVDNTTNVAVVPAPLSSTSESHPSIAYMMADDDDENNNNDYDDDDDDDYDDDEEVQEDNSNDLDHDDEDVQEDSSDDSNQDDEYNPTHGYFTFRDEDSDDDVIQDQDDTRMLGQQNWMRRQISRIHVLRALIRLDDHSVSRFSSSAQERGW